MLVVTESDDSLACLRGRAIASASLRGVEYRILHPLGSGGMSNAFLALRASGEGETLVVLKMLRPQFVLASGPAAALSVKKEAAALGRLNERVPPTPLVVRLLDAGELAAHYRGRSLALPWLVVEYVHGGAEGTTLLERVEHSIASSGFAFDSLRAERAIDCLARGVAAVHDVGVLHRDIKPENILCCGFGDDELFKLADFGLARSSEVAATFGLLIGTPGYAPPELTSLDPKRFGAWTDVFATACVVYFLLTGEDYFDAGDVAEAMALIRQPHRRSILESRGLTPDLRQRPQACREIDAALARASAPKYQERTASAPALAASLLPHLRIDSMRSQPARDRIVTLSAEDATELGRLRWSAPWNPGGDTVIRRVDWDGDGNCLAVTTRGLRFWTGTEWRDVVIDGVGEGIRFVRRAGPGRWVLGGTGGALVVCTFRGIEASIPLPDARLEVELLHGDVEDLAVLIASGRGAFALHARVGRHWLRPLAMANAVSITGLARVDDERWLVTGREASGQGFASIHSPLSFELLPIKVPATRALLAAAGQPQRRLGLAVGADGAILWWENETASIESLGNGENVSAAAIDVFGRGWAASAGTLWMRRSGTWGKIWHDASWTAPFVSMFVEPGLVIAVTADGGVLEGRMRMPNFETWDK